jgi:magnesium transporter
MRDNGDFSEQLRAMVAAEDQEGLFRLFDRQHPHDVAERLREVDDETAWEVIRRLPRSHDRTVFSHLPMERQVRLMEAHADGDGATFLEHLEADDRVALVQSLPNETRHRLLARLDREARADIERLSIYRPGTAGSVMNTDVVTLPEELTVEAAIERLRAVAAVRETIYYNYVTDPRGKLLGIVSLRDLLLSAPETRLGDLMSTDVISAWVDDDQEQVAQKIREYDLIALPVLHGDHRLAGVVTVDDAIDVSNEETTEDFHRIASVGHFTGSLRDASPWLLYQKRVPWLLVLVFFNIFSGAGIAYFENTIAAYASLVFFLPLLIDSGGNAGAQSATLMVRGLAMGEVVIKDWFYLTLKEMGVALSIGVTMAMAVTLIGIVRAPEVVTVVALSMVGTVFFGSLIGMLLPFLLTQLRLDPATASAPLITSLADLVGVLIYFGIATWYLGIG